MRVLRKEGARNVKRGAIFDMDGLLFNTERLFQEIWANSAMDFDEEPNYALARAVCGTSGEHLLEIVRSYYPQADASGFVEKVLRQVEKRLASSKPEFMPGALDMIEYLSDQGLKLAIASGSPRHFIEMNLRRSGIDSYFSAIVSGFEVPHEKPSPDVFLTAAERMGLPACECYVFEDGINGVLAGMAAGCITVMVPDVAAPPKDLAASKICSSLLEAKELIEAGCL